MSIRLRTWIGPLMAVALLATACGGTDGENNEPAAAEPADVTEEPEDEVTAAEPTEPTEAAGGPVTVSHALGETELEAPAQRVVALEWEYVEDLLALGVQPVGVADVEGYGNWVTTPVPLGADVTDVGTRQEPSLESIAALEPDLIIGIKLRHEAILGQLEAIAPTILFDPYPQDPSTNQHDVMLQTFDSIATAVDRTDEAGQVVAEMEAAFEKAAAEVQAAGASAPFLLVMGFSSEGSPIMRVFLDTSLAATQLAAIGLTNSWEGEFDAYGFNTVGVEALIPHEEANFLYVVQPEDDIFEDHFQDNKVWSDLQFVEEGRTYALGGDTWLFGGPLSAIRFVEIASAQLTQ